ncbi:MAG TPA: DUF937 domain-containing protein [bacterium]|nr:DUF937 domain-containing protein [bacterium]
MASMMEEIMARLSNSGGLDEIGSKLGVDRKTAGIAAGAAAATLLAALSRNAKTADGASALNGALERDHDGGLLDNLGGGALGKIAATAAAAGILKHLLGNRRDAVEQSLGRSTGISSKSMGMLLMMVAPIVLAQLGKARRQQNLGATDLTRLLGDEQDEMWKNQPQMSSSVASMLDADGDGDVDVSDLAKSGGGLLSKLFGQR